MNAMHRKIVAYAVVVCLVSPVQAGQLSSAMDGMFTATTNPQAFQTPSMSGVAFGSFSARFPTQNFNIIAFDPPRINAGCSGIDMYMGSFSFINAEQLKTMLRAIAQGAVGFAFKSALRAICGMCEATLSDLQHITQQMNAMGKNTCALSKMTTDYLMDKGGIKEKAEGSESLLKTARAQVQGWWSGLEQARSNPRSDRANEYNGNLIIRALYNSQATERFGASGGATFYGMAGDLPELIMNLVGTRIVPTDANDNKTCSSDSTGSDCAKNPEILIGKLSFDHILKGRSEGGERVAFYKCDTKNAEMSCQQPTEGDFQFDGTKRYVQKMLFGEDSTAFAPTPESIMGTILRAGPGSLTQPQKNFLGSVQSIPVMQIIYRTQRDRSVAQALLSRSAEFIASEMAYKIVFEAIQVTEQAFSRNTVTMPVDLQQKVASLKDDITKKGYPKTEEIFSMLVSIENLQQAMEKHYPKADGMTWLKR